MPFLTKICGITNIDDALMVASAGANYLGVLVNVDCSPRSVSRATAQQVVSVSPVPVIMLAFNHPVDQVFESVKLVKPAGVQLAGGESKEYVQKLRKKIKCEIWKSIHISVSNDARVVGSDQLIKDIDCFSAHGVDKIILDSVVMSSNFIQHGGTGKSFDWSLAQLVRKQLPDVSLFLAGGINPDNITEALSQVSPDGVDLSSGVEEEVGKKNPALVNQLIKKIRNFEGTLN
jgi:phosphoribosylanthranilate isomerase